MAAFWGSALGAFVDSPEVASKADRRHQAGLYEDLPVENDVTDNMGDSSVTGGYATAENVQQCAKYILNSLNGLGMSDRLDLFSSKPEDIAAVCNCLFALIQQRQADREVRDQLEGEASKLRAQAKMTDNVRKRLEDELNDKFTELGTLEIKLRQAQSALRDAQAGAARERDGLERRLRALEAREKQWQHDARRWETEAGELRQRLRTALSSKGSGACSSSGGSGAAVSPGGADPAQTQGQQQPGSANRRTGSGRLLQHQNSSGSTADMELHKRILAASEERCAALATENASLSVHCEALKGDLMRLVARCESLGLGVSPQGDVPSLVGAGTGGSGAAATAGNSRRQAQRQVSGGEVAVARSSQASAGAEAAAAAAAVDVDALSDAELRAYLSSSAPAVQDRARRMLKEGPAAVRSALGAAAAAAGGGVDASADGGSGEQQLRAALAALQRELDAARALVRDQETALAHALASLRRESALRSGAQREAAHAQGRVASLERRVSELTGQLVQRGEELSQALQAQEDACARAEAAEKELQRLRHQQHRAEPVDGVSSDALRDMECQLSEAARRADAAADELAAVAAEVAQRDEQLAEVQRELAMARTQRDLMKRAVKIAASRDDTQLAALSEAVTQELGAAHEQLSAAKAEVHRLQAEVQRLSQQQRQQPEVFGSPTETVDGSRQPASRSALLAELFGSDDDEADGDAGDSFRGTGQSAGMGYGLAFPQSSQGGSVQGTPSPSASADSAYQRRQRWALAATAVSASPRQLLREGHVDGEVIVQQVGSAAAAPICWAHQHGLSKHEGQQPPMYGNGEAESRQARGKAVSSSFEGFFPAASS